MTAEHGEIMDTRPAKIRAFAQDGVIPGFTLAAMIDHEIELQYI